MSQLPAKRVLPRISILSSHFNLKTVFEDINDAIKALEDTNGKNGVVKYGNLMRT
jgi:hypothetical protein